MAHCGEKPKRIAFGLAPLGIISIGIVPMGVVAGVNAIAGLPEPAGGPSESASARLRGRARHGQPLDAVLRASNATFHTPTLIHQTRAHSQPGPDLCPPGIYA